MTDARPTLGWQVIDWIETYLCHGPGDVQGDPIVLDDEWASFILRAYEVEPADSPRSGQRAYTEAWLSRPKGRAKSELASMISCAELLGPVRFDGWDAAGQPVGRAPRYREVLSLATEEGQAGFVYLGSKFMLENGKAADEYQLDTGLTRTFVKDGSGSLMQPVTSGATSKDGGKSTFIGADETHLWTLPELHQLFETVQRNIVKRKVASGWLLQTTTMFQPGQRSVAEAAYAYAQQVLSGEIPHGRFLWDHREAPIDTDVSDDEVLTEALRHVYGAGAEWANIEGIVALFRDPRTKEADNRRFFLNQPWKGDNKAVDPARWDSLARGGRPEAGAQIVLCFDGSKSRDSTALVAWTVAEVPHLFPIKIWERPHDARSDWKVPRAEVRAAVSAAREGYLVRRMVCDPPGWQSQIDDWAEEFGEDANGDPIVIEFDTNQPSKMGPAIDRFLDEALVDGTFTHNGDLTLTQHVLNAVRGKTSRAGRTALVKEKDDLKIDAFVAAIIGYEELGHIGPEAVVDVALNVW